MDGLYPAKAIQRGVRVTPTERHHNTARHERDSRIVQQLHISTKIQRKDQIMPRSSEAKQAFIKTVHRGHT